jgi:hypothetical protein
MKSLLFALKWAPVSLLCGLVLVAISVYFLMYPLAPPPRTESEVFSSPVLEWFELWCYTGILGGAWLVFRALTGKAPI